jgi:hypothetical protein
MSYTSIVVIAALYVIAVVYFLPPLYIVIFGAVVLGVQTGYRDAEIMARKK